VNAKPVRFLLVEDDPDHAWLVSREFELHRADASLDHVDDADAALALLRGEGRFGGRPNPDVVLVDLNLPRKSGFELLSALRAEPRWQGIRAVVLTTSSADTDRRRAAPLADGFVTKPVGLVEFRRTIGELVERWVEAVRDPSEA
jgi:CheY-like chemotaxis protein